MTASGDDSAVAQRREMAGESEEIMVAIRKKGASSVAESELAAAFRRHVAPRWGLCRLG